MSGFEGDLSEAQAAALASFKTAVADVFNAERHEDRYLLRFLRARKWDLAKAQTMFRNTLAFRAKWKLDTILQDYKPPQFLIDYFPWGMLNGLDKSGHVVEWIGLGDLDSKGLLLSTSVEELTRYKLWRVEEVDQKARETKTWQITVVTDVGSLSSRHLYRPGLKYFSDTEKMIEDHYPELLYKVLIIRPPRIFNLLYGMVKHTFDPVTRAKFELVSGDPLARMAEVIDKGLIPTRFGGGTEYKDPRQLSFGGLVPENLYKANDETFQRVVVAASSMHVHRQVVDQAGTTLVWDFYTEDADVSFGVFHVPAGTEEHERDKHRPLVPLERVNAHTDSMAGNIILEDTGVYHIVWDNSYSWMKKKVVNYKIDVVKKGEVIVEGEDGEASKEGL